MKRNIWDKPVGVHVKQPDGSWAVQVRARTLRADDVIVVRMRGGKAWLAPVKRIISKKKATSAGYKLFTVQLSQKLRDLPRAPNRAPSMAPSGVFFE